MKTITTLTNLQDYLPANSEDYAFATQISDKQTQSDIARILILYAYDINHRQKRIVLDGELKHIRISDGKDVSNEYNCEIKDWVVNNSYYAMVRDENGNMIRNPEYVKIADRVEGQYYMAINLSKYIIKPAFTHFSENFKTFTGTNQTFFNSIVESADQINNLFDVYGSLTMELMKLPPKIHMQPDLLPDGYDDEDYVITTN